jgi:hypothetical protein
MNLWRKTVTQLAVKIKASINELTLLSFQHELP